MCLLLRVHTTGSVSSTDPTRAQLVEHHADLESCETRAQAVMDAVPESEVRIRVSVEVELERSREDGFVAIRRGFPEHDLVAGAHPLTAEVDVASRGPTVVRRRMGPAHDLFDSGRSQRTCVSQRVPLVGEGVEGDDGAGDRVACGVGAGGPEQREEELQLLVGELGRVLSLQMRVAHHREHVVGGSGALLGDQCAPVLEHRCRGESYFVRRLEGLPVAFEVEGVLDPLEELVAIAFGDAHQDADCLHRQLTRDVAHEIALALPERALDEPRRATSQVAFEAGDRARRQTVADEESDPLVTRVIHHVEHETGHR